MPSAVSLVHDLLTYIEHVEKLKTKPAFTVPTEYFIAYQHDLKGLPELQFNLQNENEDIWLRVPRLQEVAAPGLDDRLAAWVVLSKSPSKTPELKTQITISDGNGPSGVATLEDHPDIQERFDWYVENLWNPWAAAERPRREEIKRYNQLFALQQAISSEGTETPLELVWGIGYATWKKEGFGTALKHPLIVQSCEVTLNEDTFDLEVRPRDVEPRLEADAYAEMEIPGVRPLEAFWKSFLANGADRVNPFEGSTFEGALKAAVGHLDQTGAYRVLVDDVTPPPPSDKLSITNTWVLYARKRSTGIFLEDVKRLKENVAGVENLPAVVRSFVEIGDDQVRVPKEQAFRGLSSSESPADAFELYFPMPYNEEQVSIVQKLEHGEGVVVQGPPGTGKTHTIANIICHYLAQGKRVLVTSKGESALMEVLGKLPERIRPLSVALLSDDREGLKQFEHSIQTIAASVSAMNPARAGAEIARLQDRLSELHAKISYVDHAVNDFAHKHMRNYNFQGKEVSPEDIAKLVLAQADGHQWMDDDLPSDEFEAILPFDEGAISALRQARLTVGASLPYLGLSLPMADAFPAWSTLLELHRDLVRARSIENDLALGAVMKLADSTFETFEKAKALIEMLDQRQALRQSFTQVPEPLLDTLAKHLGDMKPDDLLLGSLLQSCRDIEALEGRRQGLITKAVGIPDDAELNPDFVEAATRLAAGKSAFALPFGKGEARKLVAGITVLGSAPQGKDDWALVEEAIAWRKDSKKLMSQWNAVAAEFGIAPQTGTADSICKRVHQLQRRIIDLHRLTFDYDAKLHGEIERVFGKHNADKIWDGGEAFIAVAKESLQTHIDKGRLAYTMNRVSDLVRKLEPHDGPIVAAIRSFFTGILGKKETDEEELHKVWLSLQAELSRVAGLRPAFDTIAEAANLIKTAGAPKWAKRLRTDPADVDHDRITPSAWREAWNWRSAVMFLERIDGHAKMRELFAQRKTLTTALARTYQDLVAEKT